jgi:hypothetical protein
VGIDLLCEWFVMADHNVTLAEVFQFLAFALVLFLSGRLVVRSAINEEGYVIQAVPLVEIVCFGINPGLGAVRCAVGEATRARVGTLDARSEICSDRFPEVWRLGLQLPVAPLLPQGLPCAD